jgi:hypothetical protein
LLPDIIVFACTFLFVGRGGLSGVFDFAILDFGLDLGVFVSGVYLLLLVIFTAVFALVEVREIWRENIPILVLTITISTIGVTIMTITTTTSFVSVVSIVSVATIVFEPTCLVLLTSFLPVVWVPIPSVTVSPVTVVVAMSSMPITATTAILVTPSPSTAALWPPRLLGFHLAILNLVFLLRHVSLLRHDLERIASPFRLWIKSKELLLSLFILPLDKYRPFEQLLLSTTETNLSGGAVGQEKVLYIKLGAWFLVTKTFDIDGSSVCLGTWSIGVIWNLTLNALFTFVLDYIKELALFQCSNDHVKIGEALHAVESMNLLNSDGIVRRATGLVPQERVGREIGVAQIELDLHDQLVLGGVAEISAAYLTTNQSWVVRLLQDRGIVLDVLALVLRFPARGLQDTLQRAVLVGSFSP